MVAETEKYHALLEVSVSGVMGLASLARYVGPAAYGRRKSLFFSGPAAAKRQSVIEKGTGMEKGGTYHVRHGTGTSAGLYGISIGMNSSSPHPSLSF